MRNWLIELEGSLQDIKFLQSFLKSRDFQIFTDGQAKYLSIFCYLDTDDPSVIREWFTQEIEILNGATKLYNSKFKGVIFTKVHRVLDNGTRESFGFVTAPRHDYTLLAFVPSDTTLTKWICLAREHSLISRALALYGAVDHNYRNLYMILEVIKEDCGSWNQLFQRGWASKSKIKNFKQTANSYEAVGRKSRHGSRDTPPPKKPISLDEAKELIDRILVNWIASFAAKED